jgi:hypothetical protein
LQKPLKNGRSKRLRSLTTIEESPGVVNAPEDASEEHGPEEAPFSKARAVGPDDISFRSQ